MSETKTTLTDLLLASKRWQGLEGTYRAEVRKIIASSAANLQTDAAKSRRQAADPAVCAGDQLEARARAALQSDMAAAMSVLVEMIDGAETAQLG